MMGEKKSPKLRNSGGLLWHTKDITSLKQQREELWRVISENTGNPLLRQQASKIIRDFNIPERNELALVTGILKYFQDNVKFFREYPEFFASPMRTIEMGIGDCDDKSIGVAAIVRTFRIPVRLKIIRYTENKVRKGHVYPQAWVNNKWLTLETVRRWAPGTDAEKKLSARGIKVNVEYIGDSPTKFRSGNMIDDFDNTSEFAVDDYENPLDTTIDNAEVIVDSPLEDYAEEYAEEYQEPEQELGFDSHEENIPSSESNVVAHLDDTEDDVKTRPMPRSFRTKFPQAKRIYFEMMDGRKILFERNR